MYHINCVCCSCILFLLVAAENGIVLGSSGPTTTSTTAGNATVAKHSVTDGEIADSEAELPNGEPSEMNPQLLKVG